MSKPNPFERYQSYVDSLKESGEKFPCNQFGDLNLTVVAKRCGNRRQWFSENADKIMGDTEKKLSQIIRGDASFIGTEQSPPKDKDSVLQGIADNKSKENSKLKRALVHQTAEVENLRKQLEEANAKLRCVKQESKDRYEEMCENGRSFNVDEP